MGGDGGVIATKRAYARGVGRGDDKKDSKNIQEEQATRATTCALTNEPLQSPLVACELGNIFNKEAILTTLLDRSLPTDFSHIKGLKDLKNLDFAVSSTEDGRSVRVCPVTQDEFNGSHPFVVLWPTGKVLSEKAIREIGIDGLQEEYGPFTSVDIVKLIPVEQEMDSARAAMHHRREARKANKKSKATTIEDSLNSSNPDIDQTASGRKSKKRRIDEVEGVTEEDSAEKRPPGPLSSSSATAPTSRSSANNLVRRAVDNVEQNTKESSIYKSLFHKDGEKDKKDKDLFMTVAGLRYTIN